MLYFVFVVVLLVLVLMFASLKVFIVIGNRDICGLASVAAFESVPFLAAERSAKGS